MIIKFIFFVIIILLLIEPIYDILKSFKNKTFYETYKYLGSSSIRQFFQFFYVLFLEKKIYQNALSTEYDWFNVNSKSIEKIFESYKRLSLIDRLKVLDTFKAYKDNNFLLEGLSKRKKIEKDIELYEELRKLYQTEEETNE